MNPLPPNTTLRWHQSDRDSAVHELRSDGGTLALVELKGSSAIAESFGRSWRLERDVTRTIRVSDLFTGEPIGAVTRPSLMGRRTLVFHDGRRFVWEPTNPWHGAWRFRLEGADAVVLLSGSRRRSFGTVATVESSNLSTDELGLLLIVAGYLVFG